MKKIIIGYDFLNEIGGLERVMFFLANSLSKDFEVELIFSYVNEEKRKEITELLELNKNIKITTLHKNSNESIALIKSFLNPSILQKISCDLIISNSFLFSLMAKKYSKRKNIPYIVIMHHPPNFLYPSVKFQKWVNTPSRFFAFLIGNLFKNKLKKVDYDSVNYANKVIVSSYYTQKRIKDIYNIDPIVLYPPVSSFFKIISKKEIEKSLYDLGIGKTPYVLYHGRIIPDKRPDIVIEVANKMKEFNLKGKKLKFVISGDISDSMKREILKLIDKYNLNNVILAGKVSRETLRALYNGAEVFLVTAPKEDFGLTPIEAMACGTPVVAWGDSAGPSETVINKKSGLFASPYEIDDFVIKIEEALKKNWNEKNIVKTTQRFYEKNVSLKIKNIVNNIIK